MIDIAALLQHPERMDRNTLYEVRSILALYPYFQTARLALLQNLYILSDPTFDEELHKAAIYITDRRVLFNLIEAAHYRLRNDDTTESTVETTAAATETGKQQPDTTIHEKRKPTVADATIDYMGYLLKSEEEEARAQTDNSKQSDDNSRNTRTLALIDEFLNAEDTKFTLEDKDDNEEKPYAERMEKADSEKAEGPADEGFFTETLARIYIKQGRYSKALQIIKRLSLDNPQKNTYFADQIRFLEKLVIIDERKRGLNKHTDKQRTE